jgi:hypothetical protein
LNSQLLVFGLEKTDYPNIQWIKNSEFDSPNDSWFMERSGDLSDINASINSGYANFEILGEKKIFSIIADPPLAFDWKEVDNPDFPNHPDVDEITSEGCRVSHEWDDTNAIQNPSVHWDKNLTVPVNMLDYEITSATIKAVVNATVDENIDRYWDYVYNRRACYEPSYDVDTYGVGDYVRFYVLISDLEKNRVYEIANFQTEIIGNGGAPGTDYLLDTYTESVPEDALKFYLSSVLSTDNHNFTITLGIRLYIEDNVVASYDLDTFNELIIKYLNLTFTYEKKIDQLTTASWNQIGSSIDGNNVQLYDAYLNFSYKIDQIWPQELSINSEIRIMLNNYELEKTIKLSTMNLTYQEIILTKIDVLDYILTNINISLSIQVFIGDDFLLDQPITISIDDVYLVLSYYTWIETLPSSNNFLWIALSISLTVVGILGILSIRSYILLPRKQKREFALLLRTQKFKDINNIQAIILIHRSSGLPIFTIRYSELLKGKQTLFSGFLQAISIIGEEITSKGLKSPKEIKDSNKLDYQKVIELDLNSFFCLVFDIEELRTVLILKSRSSKRLKRVMFNFALAVYLEISKKLESFDGDLSDFQKTISPLVDEYFDLFYKDSFITDYHERDIQIIKKKYKLSKLNSHVMEIIFSVLEQKRTFRLMDILEKTGGKNEDSIIDAIESLIEKKVILPYNQS